MNLIPPTNIMSTWMFALCIILSISFILICLVSLYEIFSYKTVDTIVENTQYVDYNIYKNTPLQYNDQYDSNYYYHTQNIDALQQQISSASNLIIQ